MLNSRSNAKIVYDLEPALEDQINGADRRVRSVVQMEGRGTLFRSSCCTGPLIYVAGN